MVWLVLCVFFKQKTAYEMRISDWSADVCSSDLSLIPGSGFPTAVVPFDTLCAETQKAQECHRSDEEGTRDRRYECPTRNADIAIPAYADRKSVVEGKSVSVRVDLGRRRLIKQKYQENTKGYHTILQVKIQ